MKNIYRVFIARLQDAIELIRTSQTFLFGSMAIIIGLGGGIGVWLFKLAIKSFLL